MVAGAGADHRPGRGQGGVDRVVIGSATPRAAATASTSCRTTSSAWASSTSNVTTRKRRAEEEESDANEGSSGVKLTLKQFNSVKEGQKRGMKSGELAELMQVSFLEVGDAMESDTYREYIAVRY
jgi:hypothetical protein